MPTGLGSVAEYVKALFIRPMSKSELLKTVVDDNELCIAYSDRLVGRKYIEESMPLTNCYSIKFKKIFNLIIVMKDRYHVANSQNVYRYVSIFLKRVRNIGITED